MGDLVHNALRRKLAAAEAAGDDAAVAAIRARLGGDRPPKSEPEPEPGPEPVEVSAEPGPVAPDPSVAFASPQAADLADGLGLRADDFDFGPSGATGYTVADVRRAAGE